MNPHRIGGVLRSLLFVPVDRDRFIQKAAAEPTSDAVILDLEDGVSRHDLINARKKLDGAVRSLGTGRHIAVRVNNDDALEEDIKAAVTAGAHAVMLPKAVDAEAVTRCATLLAQAERHETRRRPVGIHVLIESALGLHHVVSIALADRRVLSLALGVEDFSVELGIDPAATHADLKWAHGRILEAAAIAGVEPFGFLGSITNIDDMQAYRTDAVRSRQFGYRGSLCVHPRQVDLINEAFTPTASEIDQARRVLAGARDTPDATVAVDGRMVDSPVAARARNLLDLAARWGSS